MDLDKILPKDCLGQDIQVLRNKRLFLFDMDGTIYEEDRLFDGTLQLLEWIKRNGGHYVFITNNSSRSVTDYVAKVNRLGIEADTDDFFTSSQATILHIRDKYPDTKIFCMGTRSLVDELRDAGLDVTEDVTEDVGLVLVGFDTELTSLKLRNVCEILQRDIPFIATNPDLRCPVSFGYIPDCGSICQMIENATGRRPVYIGKPEPVMVNLAMKKYGCSYDETIVVGDRLYTDILAGVNADVSSVCVLTGEATLEDIHSGSVKPTYVFRTIGEFYKAIIYLVHDELVGLLEMNTYRQ